MRATTTTVPAPEPAWASYGHDLANARANLAETEITPETVGRLAPTWSEDDLIGVSGTPIVSDGVGYFGDWQGSVWAIDADSGAQIWRTEIGGRIVGAPVVGEDLVYASSGRTLFALDRASGELRWQTEANENPFGQINASPVVADGLVFQGVASFEVTVPKEEYTFRGSIGAYDAETGEEVWRFFTTENDASSGAGVGVWSTLPST